MANTRLASMVTVMIEGVKAVFGFTSPPIARAARVTWRGDDAPEDWLQWWQDHGERELRSILMTAWDPIGSGDAAEAWDEYDDYLPAIARCLCESADADQLADRLTDFLDHVEHDSMARTLTTESRLNNKRLGERLAAWYEWSFGRRGRPPLEWIDDD